MVDNQSAVIIFGELAPINEYLHIFVNKYVDIEIPYWVKLVNLTIRSMDYLTSEDLSCHSEVADK